MVRTARLASVSKITALGPLASASISPGVSGPSITAIAPNLAPPIPPSPSRMTSRNQAPEVGSYAETDPPEGGVKAAVNIGAGFGLDACRALDEMTESPCEVVTAISDMLPIGLEHKETRVEAVIRGIRTKPTVEAKNKSKSFNKRNASLDPHVRSVWAESASHEQSSLLGPLIFASVPLSVRSPNRTIPVPNPRGLNAARKLRISRRENRWADKSYKKRALGNVYKTSPTGGSSHAKGIVLEKVGVEAKQPNSAIRKCVRVQLIKNGKKVTAFVPNDGCLNFVDENDEVLISGFGRRGKAKGDIPGVRFKVVKVSGVGLLALWSEKKVINSNSLSPFSLRSDSILAF
ncbi:40S ribosomal protein S23 [Rhizoctonia solani AG-1 IA]|uniref:40S ribosomal protein S23 n=1 Tax=Thanatephorus cucumeris (strain AG1-IA) TaxID=983506 RepID=L8WXB8_THACA|nr:40S ribosomal protein S23 [Rhizoctonia solani AG-1 IA]